MTELFLYDTLPHPTGPISSTLVSIGWGSLVAIVLLVLVPAVRYGRPVAVGQGGPSRSPAGPLRRTRTNPIWRMPGAGAVWETPETMIQERASQATLPMTGRSRGIVVPFRRRRASTCRRPSGAAEAAEKVVPCLIRLYETRDVGLNAHWDRLVRCVEEAWCWRDPDCLAAVADCLAHLRRSVDHDWS
jgi:hypothetical protein